MALFTGEHRVPYANSAGVDYALETMAGQLPPPDTFVEFSSDSMMSTQAGYID